MAKFRSRHSKSKHSVLSRSLRLIVLVAFLLVLFIFLWPQLESAFISAGDDVAEVSNEGRYFLPQEEQYPVIHKHHYSLAYAEEHEQAAWVAYQLTIEQLNARNKVKRADYFKDDIKIATGSAQFADYKGSGYTKGHLVPAADRNFSIEAMEETFLMSNMSPQTYHCNGGIWRELEEQTRDWARKNRALYIVSGPVLKRGLKKIGRNRVSVPEQYFKALLDLEGPEQKALAFVIPNVKSDRPLKEYARSIDELEEMIGRDLFYELMPNDLEDEIESQYDLAQWPFDQKRYQRRVKEWNKR